MGGDVSLLQILDNKQVVTAIVLGLCYIAFIATCVWGMLTTQPKWEKGNKISICVSVIFATVCFILGTGAVIANIYRTITYILKVPICHKL